MEATNQTYYRKDCERNLKESQNPRFSAWANNIKTVKII